MLWTKQELRRLSTVLNGDRNIDTLGPLMRLHVTKPTTKPIF